MDAERNEIEIKVERLLKAVADPERAVRLVADVMTAMWVAGAMQALETAPDAARVDAQEKMRREGPYWAFNTIRYGTRRPGINALAEALFKSPRIPEQSLEEELHALLWGAIDEHTADLAEKGEAAVGR